MRLTIALSFALCAMIASFNARAALMPYSHGGVDLVYSSFSDITWLQNGNLLGSWFNQRGVTPVINDIIAAVPSVTHIYNFVPETHAVVQSDYDGWWGANGAATFYGAYAFAEYLNAISYGGINKWRLPDPINTVYPNPFPNSYTKAGDFGQLFFDELGSAAGFPMLDPNNIFAGEVHAQYWSVNFASYVQPYGFHVGRGDQYFLAPTFPYFIWPVFDGRVPEPASAMLLAPALLACAARRRGQRRG